MSSFWQWWQHLPGQLNPVIFEIGGFRLQYYGLMYVVAFVVTYILVGHRLKTEPRFSATAEQVQALLTYMMLGVIVGGRLGYVLFYNFTYFLHHPLEIVLPFDFSDGFRFTGITGMSFHGGLACVIFFAWLYCRKVRLDFREMIDLFLPAIPLGYTFGRIGNFINGELYGRVTTLPIGMVFPAAPDSRLRHPSQLYEAFFEGVFLFAVLWSLRRATLVRGAMLAYYLIGYGTVRFFIEFVRQPDAHLGTVLLFMSMGQVLCLLMVLAGLLMAVYLRKTQEKTVTG
ncbi:MAG: prolipoprotein diacylglyceryl transferase [Deltaproteobacteria bacterium SG8_13]|nr:MAG: prolipoprotein diacylglyceryl transferase [Deltaproteobacteria bacterium SG8_13]